MITLDLHKLKQGKNFEEFYSKIESFIPGLKNYTQVKLVITERDDSLEKGFYAVEDILDDVYSNTYYAMHSGSDRKKLRQMLFAKVERKIAQKTFLEHLSFENLRLEGILKKELELLAEPFSRDGDRDLMTNEEFDDISFSHVQESLDETEILIDEIMVKNMKEKLEIQDLPIHHVDKKSLLGQLMFSTPPLTKSVIELHVFEEQANVQISEILMIEKSKVAKIISHVKARNRAIYN